jgi:fumarate hydratase, class II
MHIATVEQVEDVLTPAVRTLRDTLDGDARAFSKVVMVGRTHRQDATPLTFGQAISRRLQFPAELAVNGW